MEDLIILVIVVIAAALLVRDFLKRRRGCGVKGKLDSENPCDGCCGCSLKEKNRIE